jgi:hypothetical protein
VPDAAEERGSCSGMGSAPVGPSVPFHSRQPREQSRLNRGYAVRSIEVTPHPFSLTQRQAFF